MSRHAVQHSTVVPKYLDGMQTNSFLLHISVKYHHEYSIGCGFIVVPCTSTSPANMRIRQNENLEHAKCG